MGAVLRSANTALRSSSSEKVGAREDMVAKNHGKWKENNGGKCDDIKQEETLLLWILGSFQHHKNDF
eukprot:15338703-Ditylum_brightwellii.AAC.2